MNNFLLCFICFIFGAVISLCITSYSLIENFKKVNFRIKGILWSKHKNGKNYIDGLSGYFTFKNGAEIKINLMKLKGQEELFDSVEKI